MNILFYYKYFPNVGGVETVITVLANEFVRQGHKVGIISYNQDKNVANVFLDRRILLYALPNSSKLVVKENITEAVRLIIKEQYQILFNHDSVFDSIEFVTKVKKISDCKLVTLHHGAIYISKDSFINMLKTSTSRTKRIVSKFGMLAYFIKKVKTFFHHQKNINLCDKYVCLSEGYKKQLYRPKKTAVIYNPLSYLEFASEDEIKRKKNVVLFVGRVSEWVKRITIMLNAWKNIDTTGWEFYIVGDGPDRTFIDEYIVKNNISNVRMYGYQNPQQFYKFSKIFLMTSSTEGFPMTISEAKQFGCVPIAMNSFESITECIDNGVDGYIINNNDITTFIEKLRYLMADKSKLKKMALVAIENSKERAVSVVAEKWIKLFNSII